MSRALLAAVALSSLCACQGSYLASRGDEAFARGEYAQALSNYLTAESMAPADLRDELTAKRIHAAGVYVRAELTRAQQLIDAGDPRGAFGVLAPIVQVHAWGAEDPKSSAQKLLAVAARACWSEVDALAAKSWYTPAVQRAGELVLPLAADDELRARAAEVRRAAIDSHVARAAAARPGARLFHLRMAQRFGGLQPDALAAAAREAQEELGGGFTVKVQANAECAWVAPLLEKRLAASSGGPEIAVSLDRCSSKEERWTKPEVYSLLVSVPYTEKVTEPFYVWQPKDPSCTEPKCTRFDELGICVAHEAEREECTRLERTLEMRELEVRREKTVTSTRTREVRWRRLGVAMRGAMQIKAPEISGPSRTPIDVENVFEDRAFWSPAESKLFDRTTMADLQSRAVDDLVKRVHNSTAELQRRRLQKFIDSAAAAEKSGALDEAERAHALVFAGGYDSPAGRTFFRERYGLDEQIARALMSGGAGALPAPAIAGAYLPPQQSSEWEDEWEQKRVRPEGEKRGLEQLMAGGVDVAYTVATSPLPGVERAHGMAVRARFERVHVRAAGVTGNLGGQASGFSLGLSGVGGELDEDGFCFSFGLEYRLETASSGAGFRMFALPMWIGVPLGSWLSVFAGVEWNFLVIADLFDGDAAREHWTPIFLRATIDLGRHFYLSAGATHYLGKGFDDDPLEGTAELGIRL